MDNMLKTISCEKHWGFNVLNHGDFHIRNMMFREDSGKEREVLFLDFQAPSLNSPSSDLNTMLQLTGDFEVRERKEEILHRYQRQLTESLLAYGFKGRLPTAIDVQVEMIKSSDIGEFSSLILCGSREMIRNVGFILELYQIVCLLPVVLIPDLKILDAMENGSSTASGLVTVCKDPKFVEHMKKMLRSLELRGMFD